MFTTTSCYLGPAKVVSVQDSQVELSLPSGNVFAELALAYPYLPERNDSVLVFGEEKYFVIGILGGRGKTSFVVPGDMEIHAKGMVHISGEQGIELKTPRLTLRADRLEIFARATFERVIDSYRWVKGVIHTCAGRVRTLVDGPATFNAERIIQKAKKDIRIDGERINLG